MGKRAEGVSYAERMTLRGRRRGGWLVRERTVELEGSVPEGAVPESAAAENGTVESAAQEGPVAGGPDAVGTEVAETPRNVSAEMSNWDKAGEETAPPGSVSAEMSGWDREVAAGASGGAAGPHGDVSAEMSEWDTTEDPPPSGAGPIDDPAAPDREPVDHEPVDHEPVDHEAIDHEAIDHEAIENDELEELGNEIATITAHIHAAEYQLLVKLAEFDRRKGWEVCGHRNCAAWLAFRTGISTGASRERVRVARALEKLPKISAAMACGELSFCQVRALTRVATPENEEELLEYAYAYSGDQLEIFLRGWRMHSARDERERARLRWEAREVVVWTEAEGTVQLRARLPAAEGLMVMRTLQAYGLAVTGEKGEEDGRSDKQRRADALLMLVERATAVGTGDLETDARVGLGAVAHEPGTEAGTDAETEAEAHGNVSAEMSGWDSSAHEGGAAGKRGAAAASAAPTPLPISPRAERFLVMLHTEEKALVAGAEAERCHLDDGSRVAAETARRLTCDCSTVEVTRGANGSVLDVGRKTRKISTPMRRALEVRDRCCRFPGCTLRFVATHHVLHWGDRGPTKLANLVLLCDHHHTLVHEGGFRMDMPLPGRPNFYDRRGKLVPETPPPTRVSNALEALEREHRRGGSGGGCGSRGNGGKVLGPYTASRGRCKFDRLVPWAVEARAREAVDPS